MHASRRQQESASKIMVTEVFSGSSPRLRSRHEDPAGIDERPERWLYMATCAGDSVSLKDCRHQIASTGRT
jgi:hypothetical protein